MNVRNLLCLTLAGLTMDCVLPVARAIQVGPGAFSGQATIESFEGLSAGPNIPASTPYGPGYLVPGNTAPFTFASGVTYNAPVPNSNDGFSILIGDYALGDPDWNLALNGVIDTSADVPSGSAYMGDCCPEGTPITFTFPSDMLRVGIYATDGQSVTITMSAFDSGGGFLESVSVDSVPVSEWGSNFLGIQNAAGIRTITLTSTSANPRRATVYDDLTFEAVPEPSTLAAGIAGILVLLVRRRIRAL